MQNDDVQAWNDELWLLGVPRLADYLEFVKHRTLGGRDADEGALVDQWRAANDRYRQLERDEAGAPDGAEARPLPPGMAPLVERLMADPYFRQAYAPIPVAFGMVELDRLAVYQHHVTVDHVEQLRLRLGEQPDDETLFRLCLPFDHPMPPVRVGRAGSRRYVFHSPSIDLRYLGSVLLDADQVVRYTPEGPAAGIVGLVVGFGSNFLNVVRHGTRMVLNNGYHRAYALRAIGVTHVPCIIQVASRFDELELAGGSEIAEDPRFYYEAPRPPMFRDFFDPLLTRVFRTPRVRKQIQVSFDIQTVTVPD
ncbi:MAG: hypothetical protein HY778_01620 [Betaproteobacteria bacterium]|nr:hypothetical protein [Betaproteobacteria bacterium]